MERITNDEFFDKFIPFERNETLIYDFPDDETEIGKAIDENRIWTMLECDGKLILASGFHRINHIYFVITTNPWEKEYEIID